MRGKIFTLGAALALLAMPMAQALAQAEVQSRSLTCAQVAQLVARKGAVVIGTSPTTYDRYVRDRGFCPYDQDVNPEWVPTRDTPQCFVGYTCYDPSRGGGTLGR